MKITLRILTILLTLQFLAACAPSHKEPEAPATGNKPNPIDSPDSPVDNPDEGEDKITFKTIQTVIIEGGQCLNCHSSDRPRGGIVLETYEDLINTRLVVAGSPDNSLFYESIASGAMPPRKPLSDEAVEILRVWIAEGALLE